MSRVSKERLDEGNFTNSTTRSVKAGQELVMVIISRFFTGLEVDSCLGIARSK